MRSLELFNAELLQRTIRGGAWMSLLRASEYVAQVVRIVVLARMLGPEDFGLFGIALVVITIFDAISETGIQQALIQKKGDLRPYLDTAWTIQLARAILLLAVLLLLSPLVARFFEEPAAGPLLRVVAFSVVLRGFANIGVVYFLKELQFHKQFIYRMSRALVELSVAITAALLLSNAWALAWGFLAGNFSELILSYLIHPYRPKFHFKWLRARELYEFGRWIWAYSLISLLMSQDRVFIGKIAGSTALGLYQMSLRIVSMPMTAVTDVVYQVTFPAYSKIQEDISILKVRYLQALRLTAFLSIPMMGGMFFLAPDFTRILLGQKWVSIVQPVQALTLWGALISLAGTAGPLFSGIGRPDIVTKTQFAKLLLVLVTLYPLTVQWGILGTVMALTVAALVVEPCVMYFAKRFIRCSTYELIRPILLPLLGTFFMLGGLQLLRAFLKVNGLTELFVIVFVGSTIYMAVMMLLLDRSLIHAIRKIAKVFVERPAQARIIN